MSFPFYGLLNLKKIVLNVLITNMLRNTEQNNEYKKINSSFAITKLGELDYLLRLVYTMVKIALSYGILRNRKKHLHL
jgi:hypothetical protein